MARGITVPVCSNVAFDSVLGVLSDIRFLLEVACFPHHAHQHHKVQDGCTTCACSQDERAIPSELFEEEQMQSAVMSVLEELDEREAGILRMRLGLDSEEVFTLEEIGARFDVTRERVRQVEAKAMMKLQEQAGGGILGDYSTAGMVSDSIMMARSSRGTKKSS